MAGQAMSSVLQLSTFTKMTSIPSDRNHPDFPVTVGVKAPKMTVHQHAPVDVVAVIDVSASMDFAIERTGLVKRLKVVQNALAKVIENLADGKNKLAVVAFSSDVQKSTDELLAVKDKKKTLSDTIESLKAVGGTNFRKGLERAIQILDKRSATAKKDRLAFIIFLSDGADTFHMTTNDIPRSYPIHAFGISKDHKPEMLKAMADLTGGSYTAITQDLEKITEKLDQLSDKLSSIVAVDTRIDLKTIHPRVTLSSRVDSPSSSSTNDAPAGDGGSSYRVHVGDDKRSGEILVGAVSSGEGRQFTVYLDVPAGQGNGADRSMELLSVGGVYTQSWDEKQVALGESVVAVARPLPPTNSCQELDWIEERLKYWCNAKQDLSAMYDKAETEANKGGVAENKCKCQVTKALREASLEAINRAMHHDIYTAVLHALMLRQCRSGGSKVAAATEDAPSSSASA